MNQICYWDSETNSQKERDATPEENAEIEARKNALPSKESINEPILKELLELDLKRIRPLAEKDTVRLQEINLEIADLRKKLVK